MKNYSLSHLSDLVLLRNLSALIARDRRITASLLAHLAEVDARKLYLPAGYASMHAYCEGELRMSEDTANKRIRAARTARRFPGVFDAVADGHLTLNAIVLLAGHLKEGNAQELLQAACGKARFALEQLIAERFPTTETLSLVETFSTSSRPASHDRASDQISTVIDSQPEPCRISKAANFLPAARPVALFIRRSKVVPIAASRFDLRLTMSQATHEKLVRARSLLSHQLPNGDLAQVIDRILDLAIEQLEKRKFAATSRPSPSRRPVGNSRTIPAHVRREVWKRDGGRCTFVGDMGHRCTETGKLEFDHAVEVARGGLSTVENIRLRCRAHNQHTAERTFGKGFMDRKRREAMANRSVPQVDPGPAACY